MERAFPLELTALVGEGETSTLLSNFSGAGDELESLGPLLGLARVRDGTLSRAEYIERYGHRGPHEVELYFPVLTDDPDWFEKRLADFIRFPVDVDAFLAKQRAKFDTVCGHLSGEGGGKYSKSASPWAEWLANDIPEGLTVFAFPASFRCLLRTTNGVERLHREVRRRASVVSIFPNPASCLRLVSAILAEINEEGLTGRTYIIFQGTT
jgi:hypothetical protein